MANKGGSVDRIRRPKGSGTLHVRRDGTWVAQIQLPSMTPGQRGRRQTITSRTFCDVLTRLSALRPPTIVPPTNVRSHNLYVARQKGTHTAGEWYALCRSVRNVCAYCREPGRMTKDHAIPITRGGSDGIENIVPACFACNMEKHQLTADEYRHWRTLVGKPYGSPPAEALGWARSQGVGVAS